MDSESELRLVVYQMTCILGPQDSESDWDSERSKFTRLIRQLIPLVKCRDLDSQRKPKSTLISLIKQIISFGNSVPDHKLVSLVTRMISLINIMESDPKQERELKSLSNEILSCLDHSLRSNSIYDSDSEWELKSLTRQLETVVKLEADAERTFKSHFTSLISPADGFFSGDFVIHIISIINLCRSLDLVWLPKPESELMSLINETVNHFNSMDLGSHPKPIRELISLISRYLPNRRRSISYSFFEFISFTEQILRLQREPELVSLIHQILSLVVSNNSKFDPHISVCPQVQVRLEGEKFHVIGVPSTTNNKWDCLPSNWVKISSAGKDTIHFRCRGCNGDNHKKNSKASLEIIHNLHRKHPLQLVLLESSTSIGTRECYCCDEALKAVFYYCSTCDFAINVACVEKPPVFSIDHPRWHQHALALFPRQTSLTCNLCALADSSSPIYMCPNCDFVVHLRCINLPRVIWISRHHHRISFTPFFDKGDCSCGVCHKQIDNDYGGFSCIKDGCSFAAHSRCATRKSVWDGKELEGEPEEETKQVEPFVKISDGIIQHFSHPHHHLRLDGNTCTDYDENKQCQACIMPIYFGNFYSCMQCEFILHEKCATLSRKIYHPIHPDLLCLVGGHDDVVNQENGCSACPWLCTAGFFYKCSQEKCCFKLHVQCAMISEPLVHESHMHHLFLTSGPIEWRRCCVCKEVEGRGPTNETFNCLECDFALCFKCATLPQKVRYKHDKHILTLSYGNNTSTMTYWCEICESEIDPKELFYMCDEYCCVTLHIKCMLGEDLYMKPGSSWSYDNKQMRVLTNNRHMTRPICSFCEKRCPHKIVFQYSGLIFCSTCHVGLREQLEDDHLDQAPRFGRANTVK